MRRYGLPYKGSKNSIAEFIVESIPSRTHFYDLFAGGGAVSHCAMLSGKFHTFHMNDIEDTPLLFLESVHGRYHYENRWISREDFFNSNEPYVKYCWSFGNNLRSYLYGEEIEPYKKACHYAIVFDDFSLIKELCPEVYGVTKEALNGIKNIKKRRLAFGPSVIKELKRLGDWDLVQNNPLYKSAHWRSGKLDGKNNDLQSLESLERLERLQSLESLQRLQSLSISQKSYDEVRILPDSVIYCDIPYRGTDEYISGQFDYEKFYVWCEKQKELVVISEYDMPEDRFCCVESVQKRSLLSAKGAGELKTEKLFVPKHQIEMWLRLKGKYFNSFENQQAESA